MEQQVRSRVGRSGRGRPAPGSARRSWVVVLAVLGLAAALSGCGDGGDDDDASVDQGAQSGAQADGDEGGGSSEGGCALVSEDEVAEATGVEVSDAMELPTGCQWAISGSAVGGFWEWQEIPPDGFEANRTTGGGMGSEEISGLGDDAYLRTMLDANDEVVAGETWVLVGDTAFFVRTGMVGWSDEVAAGEQALAELLVDRVG
jgi:hypothetical protein